MERFSARYDRRMVSTMFYDNFNALASLIVNNQSKIQPNLVIKLGICENVNFHQSDQMNLRKFAKECKGKALLKRF